MIKKITVSVPGCIGNLGSGFDCIGMSIELFNIFTFELSEKFSITVADPDIDSTEENLCFKTFENVCKLFNKKTPVIRIEIKSNIPVGRGLGSSGTAVLSGIIAGLCFSGRNIEPSEILKIGRQFEGHLDDIAPSLLGGLVIIAEDNDKLIWKQFEIPDGIYSVFFISEQKFSTKKAREILPRKVPLSDAVFNLSRACLLPFAFFEKDSNLLRIALQDRLHQIYRKKFYPHFDILYDSAIQSGAAGCCLSGAGPSVVAFSFGEPNNIVKRWTHVIKEMGIKGEIKVMKPGGKTTWKLY